MPSLNTRPNLLTPDVRKDPFPLYAELRSESPVQEIEPGGIFAVSRYDDVMFILKNPELFSSMGFEMFLKPQWLPHNPIGDSMIAKDGPAHAKLRALLSHAFTPRKVGRYEPRIRAIASELADKLLATQGAEVDIVPAFAAQLPARVIAEIVGLDPAIESELRRWVPLLAAINPMYPGDEMAAAVRTMVSEMEGYFRKVVTARRKTPCDDMVTDLISAEIDGCALSDEEIVAFLFLLVPAGLETTAHLISNILLGLSSRGQDCTQLRDKPAEVSRLIEEMLRSQPPAHGVMRIVAKDCEVGGKQLKAGSLVVALLASANRDGQDKTATHSASFGHGVHYCLGAALARLEARVAIEELVRRFSGFELCSEELQWNTSLVVRGLVSLPVRCLAQVESLKAAA